MWRGGGVKKILDILTPLHFWYNIYVSLYLLIQAHLFIFHFYSTLYLFIFVTFFVCN